jgi:CheY-like chemotaxis protein
MKKVEAIQILLVESSPTEATLIKAVLLDEQDAEFEITEAESLNEAFSKMDKVFDVILLGLTLPDSSGLDTFQKMYEKASDIPIVVLSTANNEEIALNAVKIGAQDNIIKEHLENVQLVLSLRHAIERKQAELKAKKTTEQGIDTVLDGTAGEHNAADNSKQKSDGPEQNKFSGCVLVAEDSATNQFLAKKLLEEAGLHVTIANNGKEAVEKIHSQSFDLILMDMQMPEMNGDEATKALRKEGVTTPIVACTANDMEGSCKKDLDAGYDDSLAKPFGRKELLKTIGKYLPSKEPALVDTAKS